MTPLGNLVRWLAWQLGPERPAPVLRPARITVFIGAARPAGTDA